MSGEMTNHLESIIQKSQNLSPELQREALDYIEFLSQKREHIAMSEQAQGELIQMRFDWAGALAEQSQTALEVQEEILKKRSQQ